MSLVRTLSFSSVAALGALCGNAFASEYGTVVSSTPVMGQIAVPERDCIDQQVAVPQRSSGGGAVVGALIGGAVGNSVGAGMGRAAATAIGAVAGAAIGNQAEANAAPPAVSTVQRCRTVTRREDRVIGYDVVYDYGGSRRTARLAQDPGGPGSRIALDVNVAPSGTARIARSGMPVPSTSSRGQPVGQPVGQPADESYADEPQRVYRDGYYAAPPPAYYYGPPAYYAPGPVLYSGAPMLWIGGRWVVRHGYHGHRW